VGTTLFLQQQRGHHHIVRAAGSGPEGAGTPGNQGASAVGRVRGRLRLRGRPGGQRAENSRAQPRLRDGGMHVISIEAFAVLLGEVKSGRFDLA
jgi:hypothetical protein